MLDPVRHFTPPGEAAALLDAVDAASRSACGAQQCILLRLTDGRIKVVQPQGRNASALVDCLIRRYGPVSAAYFVEPAGAAPGETRVSDLLRQSSWRRSPLG